MSERARRARERWLPAAARAQRTGDREERHAGDLVRYACEVRVGVVAWSSAYELLT